MEREKHYGNVNDCNLLFDYQNKLLYKISKINTKTENNVNYLFQRVFRLIFQQW